MSGYHNLPEMVAEIQQAEANYPDLVDVFSIGKSYQGRNIWAAKISDNVHDDEYEPEVLFDALHHAREHLTVEQALATLRWLTPRLRDGRDGHAASSTAARSSSSSRSTPTGCATTSPATRSAPGARTASRTPARPPSAPTSTATTATSWGCCGGSSGSTVVDRRTAARRPCSAPETRAFRDFVASRVIDGVQQIKTHITLHTNGELILWPYGYTKTNMPPDMTALDTKTFVALGRAQAAKNGYTAQQSSELYITDGDQIDWLYGDVPDLHVHLRALPAPRRRPCGATTTPTTRRSPPRRRATGARSCHLINRAGCPYAALGADATRADCGPLFDDLEINRGWTRNAHGTDTADAGLWSVTNPSATSSNGAEAARRRPTPARRRWSPAGPPGRARTRTTSTAARRRSAAAPSACPRTPRRTARSRSATTSPTGATPRPTTRCA